jgi:polar amino acid transport system ATP-binding protein
MGMVFQSFNLFPHKMVAENIMMPQISLLGKSPKEAYDEAIRQLKKVGLETKARKYPDELSGGQKQRVAIARALAMHPSILLFDEPTSALDPAMVSEVLSVIRDLAGTGLTIMIVTHEMRLARMVSSRVFYMDQGGIYEEGTPEQIFQSPVRERTRSFILRIQSWEYTLAEESLDVYEMMGSLEAFCFRQFMDRKAATNCQLAVEELAVSRLIPALEAGKHGSVSLRLSSREEGADRMLEVDTRNLPDENLLSDVLQADPVSEAILKQVLKELPSSEPGIRLYQIL